MSTAITADDLLAAFKKRGVKYRFYKDYADFKTHNRNAAGANTSATPGGFGPIRGVVWHNFGSSGTDTGQLAYLYRGDGEGSSKPGPLCLAGITDDGTLVLMGWGTATHAGPADPKVEARARANTMPLDGELRPTTMGTDPGTVPINPFYLGFEMCHGSEGPTAAQKASLVLATAAIMELLGGIRDGYTGGSVMMHRELTYNRSDPQGVPKDGALRAQVTATLKKWATPVAGSGTTTPAPAPTVQRATTVTVTPSAARVLAGSRVTLTATVAPAVAGVVRFDWTKPGSGVWTEFGGARAVTAGKANVVATPSSDVVYRARFYPTDTKGYAIDWSSNVPVDVVTLADVDALEKRLAELDPS